MTNPNEKQTRKFLIDEQLVRAGWTSGHSKSVEDMALHANIVRETTAEYHRPTDQALRGRFARHWAHYDTAGPGTQRLVPPDARLPEIRRNYAAVEPIFLTPPPGFDAIIAILSEADEKINGK